MENSCEDCELYVKGGECRVGCVPQYWDIQPEPSPESVQRLSSALADRQAEFQYIEQFITESEDVIQEELDQLRALWTAFCFHHGLMVGTKPYDTYFQRMWSVFCQEAFDSEIDSDEFDGFMCEMLV